MPSQLFDSDAYRDIERMVMETINAQEVFLSSNTVGSTRAVGDAIQEILGENFESIFGGKVKPVLPGRP